MNTNQKLKILYIEAKNILEFLSDADRNTLQDQILKNSISIEQAEELKELVDYCEDIGINLLIGKYGNN